MAQVLTPEQQQRKALLKACLATAAPALVAGVALISADALSLLQGTSLSRWGILAIGVIVVILAYMFWRGRNWAAYPSLAACAIAAVYFLWKVLRPLIAYFSVNPFNSLSDLFNPLMMLSLQMVVALLSIGMGVVIYKGLVLNRRLQPRRVSKQAWVLLFIWLAVLAGDGLYQWKGWLYFKNPSDLVLRLCVGDEQQRATAESMLLELGSAAVDELLAGMKTEGPGLGLECLRRSSRQVLVKMGPEAEPALLEAIKEGNTQAQEVMEAKHARSLPRPQGQTDPQTPAQSPGQGQDQ